MPVNGELDKLLKLMVYRGASDLHLPVWDSMLKSKRAPATARFTYGSSAPFPFLFSPTPALYYLQVISYFRILE